MLCFVVVMQSFIMNSHEVYIHIHQGCFAGTGAIVRLPQFQWSKPDGYGKISQCITTTKHSKAKTVCIFLGIYCRGGRVGWQNTVCRNEYSNHHGLKVANKKNKESIGKILNIGETKLLTAMLLCSIYNSVDPDFWCKQMVRLMSLTTRLIEVHRLSAGPCWSML